MANKLNKPICASNYGNTGFGECILEPGKILGAFQVTQDFEIAEGDITGLQQFLIDKVQADIGERIFPYHQFINVTDNTEDVTINTTDYGAKIIIRDGFYDLTFRYTAGGVLAHQEFARNSGSGKFFLFYDDKGVLYGYKSGGVLKGIPVDVFKVLPWKVNTGADTAQYNMRFIINPVYLNEGNLGFLPVTDFNLFDVKGLQDVVYELVSLVGNVAKVRAFTKISGVDLHGAFAAQFSSTGAWQAENESGSAVAITSVVDDTVNGGWTITFSTVPFNAADKVYLRNADADALQALNVVGYEGKESDALEIEGPAS